MTWLVAVVLSAGRAPVSRITLDARAHAEISAMAGGTVVSLEATGTEVGRSSPAAARVRSALPATSAR